MKTGAVGPGKGIVASNDSKYYAYVFTILPRLTTERCGAPHGGVSENAGVLH